MEQSCSIHRLQFLSLWYVSSPIVDTPETSIPFSHQYVMSDISTPDIVCPTSRPLGMIRFIIRGSIIPGLQHFSFGSSLFTSCHGGTVLPAYFRLYTYCLRKLNFICFGRLLTTTMDYRDLCNVLVVNNYFEIAALRVKLSRFRHPLGFFRISSSTSSKALIHRACTGKTSSPLLCPAYSLSRIPTLIMIEMREYW